MHATFAMIRALGRRIRAVSLIGAAGALLLEAQAASQSPVGDWDCSISGSGQQGIAFLRFVADTNGAGTSGTFFGYRLQKGKLATSPDSQTVTDSRGTGGDDSRLPGTGIGGTNSVTSKTNIFGFDRVEGPWQFDVSGRIIGRFSETIGAGVVCTTNANVETVVAQTTVPITNPDGSITYFTTNITIFVTNPPTVTCVTNAGTTTGVTFVGTAVANKRLTLTASTAIGKVVYSGVVYRTDLTSLDGSWYAIETKSGQSALDLFTLTSASENNPFSGDFPDANVFNNIYFSTDGTTPTDTFEAVSMLSARKNIGFVISGGTTNSTLTATLGSFSVNSAGTAVGDTKGGDDTTSPPTPVHFKAVRLAAP